MRIGILGTGDVGKALAKGFITLGHQVKIGTRDPKSARVLAIAKELGPKASVGSFTEVAEFAEIAVLATLGMAGESALEAAGPEKFRGKVVIDVTNPIDPVGGSPHTLAIDGHDSAGERVQRLLEEAHVVKAFNTIGHASMFRPAFKGGPPDMFIAGDSEEAKKKVGGILKDFGWGVVDVGGIESSRYLEAMSILWMQATSKGNNPNQAFKMLHK